MELLCNEIPARDEYVPGRNLLAQSRIRVQMAS